MQTSFFLLMALIQLLFLLSAVRLFQHNRSIYTGITLLVIFGLFYDNLVIGLGSYIGESSFLQALNSGRYFMHALFTPMLIMYAIATADRLGIKRAGSKLTYSIFGFLTLGMIGLGIYEDIIELALVPKVENGLLRYVNANSAGPPIPSVVTILVMIIVGAFIWRSRKWSVLCLGAILMFIAAGAGASILVLANFGEILFSGSIVWTDRKLEELIIQFKQSLADSTISPMPQN